MARPYKDNNNIIVKAMKKKGITQTDISAKTGIPQQTISKYISMISDDRLPAMEQIENLVKIFECVEVDFFTFLSKFRMKGEK